MTGVSYELKGHDAALKALADAAAALSRPRELYDDIGALLVAATQENFDQEQAPGGSPWPQSIRARTEGGKTLTDTARLKNSITHEAGDSAVAVGTNLIYAAIHQTGGTIRAKTSKGLRFRMGGNGGWITKQSVSLPARPFLGLGPDDEEAIIETAGDWLAGKFGGLAVNDAAR